MKIKIGDRLKLLRTLSDNKRTIQKGTVWECISLSGNETANNIFARVGASGKVLNTNQSKNILSLTDKNVSQLEELNSIELIKHSPYSSAQDWLMDKLVSTTDIDSLRSYILPFVGSIDEKAVKHQFKNEMAADGFIDFS